MLIFNNVKHNLNSSITATVEIWFGPDRHNDLICKLVDVPHSKETTGLFHSDEERPDEVTLGDKVKIYVLRCHNCLLIWQPTLLTHS